MKTLLILIALALPAAARIGETPEECIARYGQPMADMPAGVMAFTKAGFRIALLFHQGRAEGISVSKMETNILKNSLPMSEAEITAVLDANGAGKKWKESGAGFTGRSWESEDGSRFAGYDKTKNHLNLYTKAWADRTGAEQAEAERKNLDGF